MSNHKLIKVENILFLHGWGGNEKSFAPILSFFKSRYNCICVNMPKEPDKPWTLEDYAELVIAQLNGMNVKYAHIIAHSFGARVAALLLNMQPERFGRLVLAGPAGIKPRFNLWKWFKVRLHKLKVIKSKGSSDYRVLSLNGKITFQNIIKRDLVPEISQIIHPSLIIWGAKDKSVKKYMAKKWTTLNDCTRMKTYKNSGHFCFLDDCTRFIVDAEEFINA